MPVIGTFLVVATAAGVYLGRSQFVDDVVNERVVTVSSPPAARDDGGEPRNVLLASGAFEAVAHSARVIGTPSGRVLTLIASLS